MTGPDHPFQFASSLVLTKHQKEALWGLWLSELPEFQRSAGFLHLMRFPLPPGVRRISLLKNMQLSWSNSPCIIHVQKEWLCCYSLGVVYINCWKLFYLNHFHLYMFMYFFCYLYQYACGIFYTWLLFYIFTFHNKYLMLFLTGLLYIWLSSTPL